MLNVIGSPLTFQSIGAKKPTDGVFLCALHISQTGYCLLVLFPKAFTLVFPNLIEMSLPAEGLELDNL